MPAMGLVWPTKDALFAFHGRSTAASVRQTVFSRPHQPHILVLCKLQVKQGPVTLVLTFTKYRCRWEGCNYKKWYN